MLKLSFEPFTVCVVIIFTYTPSGKLIQNDLQFAFGNHYIQSRELCCNVGHVTLFNTLLSAQFNELFPFSMFSIILSHGGIS